MIALMISSAPCQIVLLLPCSPVLQFQCYMRHTGGGFDADAYFQSLLKQSTADIETGAYITLGLDGRVRGSGAGSPNWDVLLSTFPQQLLDRAGMELSSKKADPGSASQAEVCNCNQRELDVSE